MIDNTTSLPQTSARPGNGGRGRNRPFGVYIIALLQTLNAISAGARAFGIADMPQLGALGEGTADAISGVFMAAGLVVAAGLVLLKRWAWVATMLWVGAILAGELLLYFRGEATNFVTLALSVPQVFYLNLSDVQRAFEQHEREPEIEDPV